ncbi:MAG: twin-arginine translocation pathway signal protein, partial [Pseudomonadales bacterium]
KRLIGLSHTGDIFTFAENRVVLNTGDIDVIDAVYPGTKANCSVAVVEDYRSREWAGATFYGDWLFANVMSPGVTFAIRGPWKRGVL